MSHKDDISLPKPQEPAEDAVEWGRRFMKAMDYSRWGKAEIEQYCKTIPHPDTIKLREFKDDRRAIMESNENLRRELESLRNKQPEYARCAKCHKIVATDDMHECETAVLPSLPAPTPQAEDTTDDINDLIALRKSLNSPGDDIPFEQVKWDGNDVFTQPPATSLPKPDPKTVDVAMQEARDGKGRTIDEILAALLPKPTKIWTCTNPSTYNAGAFDFRQVTHRRELVYYPQDVQALVEDAKYWREIDYARREQLKPMRQRAEKAEAELASLRAEKQRLPEKARELLEEVVDWFEMGVRDFCAKHAHVIGEFSASRHICAPIRDYLATCESEPQLPSPTTLFECMDRVEKAEAELTLRLADSAAAKARVAELEFDIGREIQRRDFWERKADSWERYYNSQQPAAEQPSAKYLRQRAEVTEQAGAAAADGRPTLVATDQAAPAAPQPDALTRCIEKAKQRFGPEAFIVVSTNNTLRGCQVWGLGKRGQEIFMMAGCTAELEAKLDAAMAEKEKP